MKVTQVSIGRFHHFHLARQLERHGLLKEIWTGYPRFKLKDENGIPPDKIKTFPWFHTPYMAWNRIPMVGRSDRLRRELGFWAHETLDRRVAMSLREPTILVALSGQGRHSGRKAQQLGGRHICDRGSSHIRFQNDILREEHQIWGMDYTETDARMAAKEEAEYENSDLITIPSQFCEKTFVSKGVAREKLRVVPYGGRLDRFFPIGTPTQGEFNVLFVGQVSLRKGIPYLLTAFEAFKHPKKRLTIIGSVQPGFDTILRKLPLKNVEFLGNIPNARLAEFYSRSDVLILPSIEEGLAMVMAEAMACGCPVIATGNTGAEDLFDPAECGAIIDIRDAAAITRALALIEEKPGRDKAAQTIKRLEGWDSYGDLWQKLATNDLRI